ncbi:gamma-glutamyltransferase [Actinophytocola gossypii]|uniref:Glutathione hydrolase proenzyme n=1 Tax=Actinophytocola gossypii TaxID=2812003 RepID=A0ABT2J9Y6_9PSEU|nr:gamma-glutamyltransferase [Actinophytocola gossypii]MCT2584596.1 gamma-glutamyltransferase [Actinophytocola gossypii]
MSLAVLSVALLALVPGVGLAQPQPGSDHPFGKPSAEVPNPGELNEAVRASRPVGYRDQTRSEVLARNGVAATSNPLATAAAERILLQGGNAVDAAVAASAALGTVEPMSTGMGGDLFAIVWSAKDQKLYSLASSGWAPKRWTVDYFTETLGVDEVPSSGINSAVIPGTVSGWDALLKRFGSMGFREVLEPAADYASDGFPIHERMHGQWVGSENSLARDPDSANTWLPDGEAPELYSIFRNPEMARTLRSIQRHGRDAFYKGDIAKAIVEKSASAGGVISRDDLAKYRSEWVTPLSTDYHGYRVHQLPPPGQGFAALEMLNILEVCTPRLGFDLAELGPRGPRYWHLLIEAKKLAYSDLHRYNADPKFDPPPLNRLLSKDYAAQLCDRIDPDHATPLEVNGVDAGSTVYFATADRWGNMVSLVNSNYSSFGSKVTIPGYGFVLANRGSGFTLDEDHPNVVEPRKRPFITIIASFITKNGRPVMAFGNMGGGTQPQAHAQHVINMIDLGMNVQATTDVARFDHSQENDVTSLDTHLYDLVGPTLTEMGHDLDRAYGHAGGYQGILFEPDPRMPKPILPRDNGKGPRHGEAYERPVNGVYRAGSDPRKDGHAGGW